MAYSIHQVALGSVSRLYSYYQQGIFGAALNLKGFEYPWLLSARQWKKDERVLDVGAAYSPLPIHIQEAFGSEVWVADDFGTGSDEPFWQRGRSHQEHIAHHPNVKYVLERLGEPTSSSLPTAYFDVIYSLSTLEHVPTPIVPAVWRHMHSLLKPGGEMLHAIDIPFPSNRGWRKVLGGMIFDAFYALIPRPQRLRHYMATPKAMVGLIFDTLGIHAHFGSGISVIDMVFNPDVLAESYEINLNRIVKDKIKDYTYQRIGTLLLHIRKNGI